MERELRKKSFPSKKHGPPSKRKRGGSSSNPSGEDEERVVIPFPRLINFRHEKQNKKFEQLMNRKIVPNKYISTYSLQSTGLLDEVNMYINRIGWGDFVLMQSPSYVRPTCEFLSSFNFDEHALLLKFCLGNMEHQLGLFELNDVFHFPKNQDANVEYDRDAFWRELTGERRVIYEARSAKESRIRSPSLKYLHRLMSHSLFSRKEGDAVVTINELNILYCMVNDRKLDLCHAIAIKLRDVANKMSGAIKVGGMVTTLAKYLGFDVENMPFDKVKGRSLIDSCMMEAMGLIRKDLRGRTILIQSNNPPPAPQQGEEEDQEVDLNDVVERLDNLELQVGVIDSNVGELTSLATRMDDTMIGMNHRLNMINHNLMAYFNAQNFVPPPFPPHDEEANQEDSSEEARDD